MIKDISKVREAYEKKVADLINVRDSGYPAARSYKLYEAHERRCENAKQYLDELDEIGIVFSISNNIIISSVETVKEVIKDTEYSRLDYNGKFVKLWLLQKFGHPSKWILCMAPLKVL